jgi:hypothetical protein
LVYLQAVAELPVREPGVVTAMKWSTRSRPTREPCGQCSIPVPSVPGRGGLRLLRLPYAACVAQGEKVLSDLRPGILGLTATTVLFAAVPAPRPSSTAYRPIPQGSAGRGAGTDTCPPRRNFEGFEGDRLRPCALTNSYALSYNRLYEMGQDHLQIFGC